MSQAPLTSHINHLSRLSLTMQNSGIIMRNSKVTPTKLNHTNDGAKVIRSWTTS